MKELEIRKGLLVRPKTNSFKDTDENRDAEDEFDSLSSLGLPSPAVAFSSKENLPEGDTQELSPSESDSGSLVSSKETDMLLEKTGKLLSRVRHVLTEKINCPLVRMMSSLASVFVVHWS